MGHQRFPLPCLKFDAVALIVALSDPNDPFPTGGSIKFQTSDDNWEKAIEQIILNSRAIILFEGQSDGLEWEIRNIRKWITHDTFFIAIPPLKYKYKIWLGLDRIQRLFYKIFKKRETALYFDYLWSDFSSKLKSNGIILPENYPGENVLISFNADWHYENITPYHKFCDVVNHIPKPNGNKKNFNDVLAELKDFFLSTTLPINFVNSINRACFTTIYIPPLLYFFVDYIFYIVE